MSKPLSIYKVIYYLSVVVVHIEHICILELFFERRRIPSVKISDNGNTCIFGAAELDK